MTTEICEFSSNLPREDELNYMNPIINAMMQVRVYLNFTVSDEGIDIRTHWYTARV